MASLKLITEHKTTLYYKKYKYRLVLSIPHIGRIRECNTIQQYKSKIDYLITKNFAPSNFLQKVNLVIVEKVIDYKVSGKLFSRLAYNSISFYANDLNELINLSHQYNDVKMKLSEVIAPDECGVILFKKDPPTKFRTYIKRGQFSVEIKERFQELIDRYVNTDSELFISKGLMRWLSSKSRWVWGSYFIGYNDEKTTMLLSLMIPEIIDKHYKLEKLQR